MFLTVLASFIFLFWLIKGTDLIVGTWLGIPLLSKLSVRLENSPKVSIIFGARNEEAKILDAAASMLAQDYPDFEVIAVDDRSTDKTGAILDSLKQGKQESKLQILHLNELPAGWLGKNHALYKGYQRSLGDWLLFTDGDVRFAPSMLGAALKACEDFGLDHLVLLPHVVTHGFWEACFMNVFSFFFNLRFRPWAAADPKSKAYIGIGSFNLIRRTAYEKIGTHKALALVVSDDMSLGKLIKYAGFRQKLMDGKELITERWVEGFQGVMTILEKNAFTGVNYSLPLLVAVTVGITFLDVFPFILVFCTQSLALGLSLATTVIFFFIHLAGQKYERFSIVLFFIHPLATLLMLVIIWRSALRILKAGGVCWRDTFYPLKELKAFMGKSNFLP